MLNSGLRVGVQYVARCLLRDLPGRGLTLRPLPDIPFGTVPQVSSKTNEQATHIGRRVFSSLMRKHVPIVA